MKVISLNLVLVAFLIALFQYPTNIYLEKFTVILYLYVVICLFATLLGLFIYFFLDIPDEAREKAIKDHSTVSDILEIAMAILFILNDMYVCFFVYSISIILATILFKLIKSGNKEK